MRYNQFLPTESEKVKLLTPRNDVLPWSKTFRQISFWFGRKHFFLILWLDSYLFGFDLVSGIFLLNYLTWFEFYLQTLPLKYLCCHVLNIFLDSTSLYLLFFSLSFLYINIKETFTNYITVWDLMFFPGRAMTVALQ